MNPIEVLGISFFIAVGIILFIGLAAIATSLNVKPRYHIKKRRKS